MPKSFATGLCQKLREEHLPASTSHIGFIAQEAEAALGPSIAGTNVIGKMTREVSGGTEDLKTLSY